MRLSKESLRAPRQAHRDRVRQHGRVAGLPIRGVTDHLPNAQIAFDKSRTIAHSPEEIDKMRRAEQKLGPSLKGLRWVLLKDRGNLTAPQRAELDGLLADMTTTRAARTTLLRAAAGHSRP